MNSPRTRRSTGFTLLFAGLAGTDVQVGNHARHGRAVHAPPGLQQLLLGAVVTLDPPPGQHPQRLDGHPIERVGHRDRQRAIVRRQRQDLVTKRHVGGYRRQGLGRDVNRRGVDARNARLLDQGFPHRSGVDVPKLAQQLAQTQPALGLHRQRLVKLLAGQLVPIDQHPAQPPAGTVHFC